MLVDADDLDALEAALLLDQDSLALGQHGVVRGVPRDTEAFSDPGDGEVLNHDAHQRPPQPAPRQLRSRLGRGGGVLAPHPCALAAPVAANRDLQRGRSPTQRLMRESPDHGVACDPLGAATPTPPVRLYDSTSQDRSIRFKSLSDHSQAETIKTSEGGQIRRPKPAGGVASGTSRSSRWRA